MSGEAAGDRAAFEGLVAGTVWRPRAVEAVRAELERQTLYQPKPDRKGLADLAELLARSSSSQNVPLEEAIERLERKFADQPLVHLYVFALRREAGEDVAARGSLDALLALDPADPMAAQLDAQLRAQVVVPASEKTRLANIAKFANTPLLKNPYSLAVGVLFEAIRERERARVLDIGVGSGAQIEGLLGLLGRLPHGVRRLEIVGLDCMPDFLARAGERIAAAAERLTGKVEVLYEPVQGRVEGLDESAVRALAGRGVDAANASIALHEVAGEAKLAALSNLRRIEPVRLVIAEWNYCLENVLAETSTEFVFNVRRVAAAMVAALRERYTIEESRAVVRDWLSQGAGQLTCAADQRQECFLDITAWKALLEHSGFGVLPVDRRWLAHAAEPRQAAVAEEGWYMRTSGHAGVTPVALLVASPS